MINPSAILYVRSPQFSSASVTAALTHQWGRLYVSQEEDTAALSARKLQKSLFPDRRCDKATSAPQRNVKAPSRRRNKGKGNRGEKPSRSPDLPEESPSVCAEGTSRWMRSSQRCQTTERVLPGDPDPHWNAGKMQGAASKQTVPPSPPPPDIYNTSPEQLSEGSLKVRRATRANRQHKKRGEDPPQLQHSEESRTDVRKRGRAGKDESKKIPEPTNMKSSTSSKKAKRHKRSTQLLAEEDEDKWTEEELAMLQQYVCFPDSAAQCSQTGLDSSVFVCLGQGSGDLSKTHGRLLGKGGQGCGNTLSRRLLQPAHFPGNLPVSGHERQEKGKETAGSSQRSRWGGVWPSMRVMWLLLPRPSLRRRDLMHPDLCSRQPANICRGGDLEAEAAGTPLSGDHAQRKRG